MPLSDMPLRQAIRILQSSWLLCLNLPCRSGRPHEYFKAPGSYASTRPAALAGHTNTSKLLALMPLSDMPLRQATRILQSSSLICLNLPCRTGRPHEYSKAPDSYASTYPVAPAGHTNTSKLQTHMPLLTLPHKAGHTNTSKSLAHMPQLTLPYRQAIRILQSSRLICLNLPCRFGRPITPQSTLRFLPLLPHLSSRPG